MTPSTQRCLKGSQAWFCPNRDNDCPDIEVCFIFSVHHRCRNERSYDRCDVWESSVVCSVTPTPSHHVGIHDCGWIRVADSHQSSSNGCYNEHLEIKVPGEYDRYPFMQDQQKTLSLGGFIFSIHSPFTAKLNEPKPLKRIRTRIVWYCRSRAFGISTGQT